MAINRSEVINIMNEMKTGSIDIKIRVFSAADNIDDNQTINTH